ncbi:MAG: hypothetical protein SFU91_12380 [Chloroherpetonaceae bacterium]|nr:hypothetical protein [Chloroherpetonaceae bacterium]
MTKEITASLLNAPILVGEKSYLMQSPTVDRLAVFMSHLRIDDISQFNSAEVNARLTLCFDGDKQKSADFLNGLIVGQTPVEPDEIDGVLLREVAVFFFMLCAEKSNLLEYYRRSMRKLVGQLDALLNQLTVTTKRKSKSKASKSRRGKNSRR